MSRLMCLYVEADNDFKPGYCINCPISVVTEDWDYRCPMYCSYDKCPLMEVGVNYDEAVR